MRARRGCRPGVDDEQSVERVVADLCAPRGDGQDASFVAASRTSHRWTTVQMTSNATAWRARASAAWRGAM